MRRRETLVIDVSVYADYYLFYPRNPERHKRARRVLDSASRLGAIVYEPFIFDVELRAVLVRRIPPQKTLEVIEHTVRHVNIVGEEALHDIAADVALRTGCRAVDAYYIAVAKLVDGILLTNDRVMKRNASLAGIEAYYLLDDHDYNIVLDVLSAIEG